MIKTVAVAVKDTNVPTQSTPLVPEDFHEVLTATVPVDSNDAWHIKARVLTGKTKPGASLYAYLFLYESAVATKPVKTLDYFVLHNAAPLHNPIRLDADEVIPAGYQVVVSILQASGETVPLVIEDDRTYLELVNHTAENVAPPPANSGSEPKDIPRP